MLIDQDRAATPTDTGRPASHTRRTVLAALLLAIAAPGIPLMEQAAAADALKGYPNRPIRLIVPQTAGSSIDTLGRIFAARMSEALGQQLVVDNRAGAGGLLGFEIGKNATPDGYTLILSSSAGLTIVPNLHKNVPYDPMKDFEFISVYGAQPNVLIANPGLPTKSVGEFIAYAKTKGRQLNMAFAGVGSTSHFSGTAFMMAANLNSTPVPYKGGGPSVAAVVAGESHWSLTPAAAVMSLVKAGRLRALAHSFPKRVSIFGDMPAIAETLPGFENVAETGLVAPRGVPKPILDKLHRTLVKVISAPDIAGLFADQGCVAMTSTPEEFRNITKRRMAHAKEIIRVIGLKVD